MNPNQTPDPSNGEKLAQQWHAIADKLLEYEQRINSSFEGYLDGQKELIKLKTLIQGFDERILELQQNDNQLNREQIKYLQQQKEFYSGTIALQEKNLANVNLLVFGYQKIEKIFMGLTAGALAAFANYVLDADKSWRQLNLTIGTSNAQADIFKSNLADAAKQSAQLGATYGDLAEIQETYNDNLGTAVALSSQNLTNIAEMAKGTRMGGAEAAKMAAQFTLMGKSIGDIKDFYQDVVNQSIKFGVNANVAIKKINDNLAISQKYVFKGGVDGLKNMSIYATKFNVSMSSVFNAIEKTNSLEGAVDAVAQLQVLGGKFAQVDPFKLLYESRNDAEAFTKTMQGLTRGIATFNKSTGQFDITAGDLQRLRLAADATGMSFEDLIAQAKQGSKIDMIDGMLGNRLNKDQKSFVESMAQISKKGNFQIQIDANHFSDIRDLTGQQIDLLMQNNKTLDQQAKDSQTFKDTFNNIVHELQATFLPVLQKVDDILKAVLSSSFGKWATIIGASVIGAVGILGYLQKAMGVLTPIFPFLKNLNGKTITSLFKRGGGRVESAISQQAIGTTTESVEGMNGAIQNSGEAAGAAWKNLLAFGGAVLMIGGGIFLATKGIASMATALGGLNDKQLAAFNSALIDFGIGFGAIILIMSGLAFSGVLEAAALGLGVFGAAVLVLGAGIGIAAAGLGYMAKGFGEMFDSLSKVTDPNLLSNLSGLIFSLTALGSSALLFANPLAWVGLKVLTSTIGDFADKISELNFVNVSTGAESFNQIATAINSINDAKLDKLMELSNSLGTLGSIAAIFSNFTNLFGEGVEVHFKDQIIPLTINLTNEIDGKEITRMISRKLPLNIQSNKKGGTD